MKPVVSVISEYLQQHRALRGSAVMYRSIKWVYSTLISIICVCILYIIVVSFKPSDIIRIATVGIEKRNIMHIATIDIEKRNCDLEVIFSKKEECKRERFQNDTTIAVLIDWTKTTDILELQTKLLPSLQYLKPMSFIFFTETSPPDDTIKAGLTNASHHYFKFVTTKFVYPEGFDYKNTKSVFAKRSKFGYMHMCRFWFKNIWLEPAVKPFKYILRFDTDSCLVGKQFSFPSDDNLVYLWSSFRYEILFITDLKKLIFDYVNMNNVTVKNKKMFELYNNKANPLPMYYNNMEITSVEFMNRPEVQKFINAVDSSHGQYKYRWGDAPLRYATLALFAEEKSIRPLNATLGKGYRHPC